MSGNLVHISPFRRDISLAFPLADLEVHIPDLTLDVVGFIQVLLVVVCRQVVLFLLVMTVIVTTAMVLPFGIIAPRQVPAFRFITLPGRIITTSTVFGLATLPVLGLLTAALLDFPALPFVSLTAAAVFFIATAAVLVIPTPTILLVTTAAVFFVTSTLIIIPTHKSAHTLKIPNFFA